MKNVNLVGCCGLSCGLCPRFQSKAKSRCPGCGASDHCPWCPVFRCCNMKKGYETCADCPEMPCEKLLKVLGVREGLDSFISHKPALPNLESIKDAGLEIWLEEQRGRQSILEELLANYNEGRSMSFYCVVSALMSVNQIKEAIKSAKEKIKEEDVGDEDIKSKAKVLKSVISEIASNSAIDLKLRKK